MRRYQVENVETVFSDYFAVDRATVRIEKLDGTMTEPFARLSVERADAIGVIVFDGDLGKLIFVRQFRYPTVGHGDPWLLECAAGVIDKGETPLQAAERELHEELGYAAQEFIPLGDFFSSPGGLSEVLTMYFVSVCAADRVAEGGGLDNESEHLEVVALTPAEVDRMILDNEFHDAKTLVGLMQAKLRGLY